MGLLRSSWDGVQHLNSGRLLKRTRPGEGQHGISLTHKFRYHSCGSTKYIPILPIEKRGRRHSFYRDPRWIGDNCLKCRTLFIGRKVFGGNQKFGFLHPHKDWFSGKFKRSACGSPISGKHLTFKYREGFARRNERSSVALVQQDIFLVIEFKYIGNVSSSRADMRYSGVTPNRPDATCLIAELRFIIGSVGW